MDVVKHFGLSHDPFRPSRDVGADDGVLDMEEARRFILTRAGVAGNTALFSPAALDIITSASRGRPAALRLLAGNAMFHAAFDGVRRVEDRHARQAVATQDLWRDVPAPPRPAAPSPVAAAPVAAATPIIAPRAAAVAPLPVEADDMPMPPPRRGWWNGAPPLARLAMVVGLLLLSLPVLGYVVGAVKDERPSAESSYLPDGGEIAAADAEAPVDTPPDLPPVATPVETAELDPPVDLTEGTAAADQIALPADEPVAVGAGRAEVAVPEPAPITEPATATAAPRVFVHYSSAQPGAADAAADVAGRLRAEGFIVADIRAVPMRIETASVRYFYDADRGNAEALHDALGGVLRPRGFSAGDLKSMTGYDPAPRRGTLEVWVPIDG